MDMSGILFLVCILALGQAAPTRFRAQWPGKEISKQQRHFPFSTIQNLQVRSKQRDFAKDESFIDNLKELAETFYSILDSKTVGDIFRRLSGILKKLEDDSDEYGSEYIRDFFNGAADLLDGLPVKNYKKLGHGQQS